MEIMGIDIGGSGIKGAIVNTDTGEFTTPRFRLPTPIPAKPSPVAEVTSEITHHFDWHGVTGIGFPAVIHSGVVFSAANIHKKWIGTDAAALFTEHTGGSVLVINDADAAGLAEMTFGAGSGRKGVVLIVTIGTGLGSSLFLKGDLVPNTELGHLEIDGKDAEWRASDAARQRENLSWQKWGGNLNVFLNTLERLFWPDLIIVGGGVSKQFDKFAPYINLRTEIVQAKLLNDAGIIGAALAAKVLTNKEVISEE